MRLAASTLALCLVLAAASCRPPPASGGPAHPGRAAVRVSHPVKESELAEITLSPEAEARLGIRVSPVELVSVPRVRLRGGEVVVPPGRALSVAAPLAGRLSASGAVPVAGARVSCGQAVFTLVPVLSGDARASIAGLLAQAEGEAAQASVRLEAARVALERAEGLLRDQAGSRRVAEESRAERDGAEAALQAARARREVLGRAGEGTLGPLALTSPLEGVLVGLHAAPGQAVAAGERLFEVADLSRLWVRVAVHVGEASQVDVEREVRVEGLTAGPVSAPPSADPARATVDLHYQLEDAGGRLRPGQSVAVELPLVTEEKVPVVERSAVVHDAHGGTWVYRKLPSGAYARRRVEVERVWESRAVLGRGAEPGEAVVVEGAAELFGAEFFVQK